MKLLETRVYSEHYHAYVVVFTKEFRTVNRNGLLSVFPLHLRTIIELTKPGQKAIVFKASHFNIVVLIIFYSYYYY